MLPPMNDNSNSVPELNEALEKLTSEVREGIKHGFFEYTIICEVVKGRKRRLTLKAGKSYQFVLSVDEITD